MLLGVLIGALVAGDGRSHWFKGVQLVAFYLDPRRHVLSDPGRDRPDPRKLSVIRAPGRSALAPGRLRLLLLSLLLLFVGTAASAGTGRARAIEGTLMVLVIVAALWASPSRSLASSRGVMRAARPVN